MRTGEVFARILEDLLGGPLFDERAGPVPHPKDAAAVRR
jgi:hypothetical protein